MSMFGSRKILQIGRLTELENTGNEPKSLTEVS